MRILECQIESYLIDHDLKLGVTEAYYAMVLALALTDFFINSPQNKKKLQFFNYYHHKVHKSFISEILYKIIGIYLYVYFYNLSTFINCH